MTKTITFNELRRLKDSLPDGANIVLLINSISLFKPSEIISEAPITNLAKIVVFTLNRVLMEVLLFLTTLLSMIWPLKYCKSKKKTKSKINI